MTSILQRVADLMETEGKYKTAQQLLVQATCELGELAQALSYEDQNFGTLHRDAPNEPASVEAIDVVISALAVATKLGLTEEQIEEIAHRKLDKWKQKMAINVRIREAQCRAPSKPE